MKLLILCACAVLCGCVPSRFRLEAEHISHPLAGWPLEPQRHSEDEVSHISAIAAWDHGGWYAEAGIGWNLYGKDGAGFYGPALTGTVRAGYEWRFRRE